MINRLSKAIVQAALALFTTPREQYKRYQMWYAKYNPAGKF